MAVQMAAKVSESFSFAKKIPMLIKATSDDENPTPGYIYQEINNITFESISSCSSLLDFLIGRLRKQSPLIKYKVLKVLSYLSTNGHSEFRSGLRHKADIIRETASFTGPMNHLRGDAFNHRVRVTASELIELLFNVEDNGESTIHAMAGPTGKKMEGFGNSLSQPTKSKTWFDSMKNLANHLPDAANLLKSKNEKEKAFISRGGNVQAGGIDGGVSFVNYQDLHAPNSEIGFKAFLDSEDSFQALEDQEPVNTSENAFSMETHLVNEITAEGGIRSVPTKESLSQFTKRCATLDIDKILEALNNRLDEPVTEVQLKSLHVMEHLLKCDLPDVAQRMSCYCTANLQEISRVDCGSATAKATKILSIITARIQQEEIHRGDVPRAMTDSYFQREKQMEELLNLEVANEVKHVSSEQSDGLADNDTLFSGMSVHATATATSKSSNPVQEEQTSAVVTDLFQGLNLLSGKHIDENDNPSSDPRMDSKSELDDLFSVVHNTSKPFDDGRTDPFDPLCNGRTSYVGKQYSHPGVMPTGALAKEPYQSKPYDSQVINHGNIALNALSATVSPSCYNNSSSLTAVRPGLTGFAGLSDDTAKSTGTSYSVHGLHNPTANRTVQPAHLLPQGLQMASPHYGNLPCNLYPTLQSPMLSGTSTVPLRLPKQSNQKSDFDFVGKSSKVDAFSFVQDEMKARR